MMRLILTDVLSRVDATKLTVQVVGRRKLHFHSTEGSGGVEQLGSEAFGLIHDTAIPELFDETINALNVWDNSANIR